MSSLEEIQAQIAELTRQAEEIRNQQKSNVIAEIREKIALYRITARDLRLDIPSEPDEERQGSGKGRGKAAPKYRDENGNTWAGGRGKKPQWVLNILSSGGNIEDYRITEPALPVRYFSG
jgi:DNA-binding protein H-NS